MEIFKEFTFDAAHLLPNVPVGHKCGRLHGHTFRVEIHLRGPVDDRQGWIVDFAEIKRSFQPLLDQLDHSYLNDVEGLANPTSESIARWIWQRLRPSVPALYRLVVRETPTAGCTYQGEDEPG